MTRKQINKLANELAELELIHQTSTIKEEVARAEKRIISITNQLMTDRDGLAAMSEIDSLVQEKINKLRR